MKKVFLKWWDMTVKLNQIKGLFFALVISLSLFGCAGEAVTNYQEGELEIEYIDVGQGDSSLLISPSGKTMLIDTGERFAYEVVASALDERGIKSLDVLLLTHPHQDHYGAAPEIVRAYKPKAIYLNGTSKSKTYQIIKKEASKLNLKLGEVTIEKPPAWDEKVEIRVFSPYKVGTLEGLNNESPIMQFRYNGHRFLFTGDAEREAEDTALAYDTKNLKSDVVKIGHHGSHTSSIPDFVLATKPTIGIISVGKGNDYGHPHKNIVNRWKRAAVELYTTEKHGNIILRTNRDEILLQTQKNQAPTAS